MGSFVLPLFLLIPLMIPLSDSIIQIHSQLRDLSNIDKKLGDQAEQTASTLNLALSLNAGLIALYALCPAAMVSGTAATLKMKGEFIRIQQDTLLYMAEMSNKAFEPWKYSQSFNAPQRNPSGVCEIPGTLYCPQKEIFNIKTYSHTQPGGVSGETQFCSQVSWQYKDSRVRALQ